MRMKMGIMTMDMVTNDEDDYDNNDPVMDDYDNENMDDVTNDISI